MNNIPLSTLGTISGCRYKNIIMKLRFFYQKTFVLVCLFFFNGNNQYFLRNRTDIHTYIRCSERRSNWYGTGIKMWSK